MRIHNYTWPFINCNVYRRLTPLYLGAAGLGEGCGVGRAELSSIQSNILSSARPSIAKQCLEKYDFNLTSSLG